MTGDDPHYWEVDGEPPALHVQEWTGPEIWHGFITNGGDDAVTPGQEEAKVSEHTDGKFRVSRLDGRPMQSGEPVFVFRAQDVCLVPLLERYEAACRDAGSPESHLAAIRLHRDHIAEWQAEHGTKVPD